MKGRDVAFFVSIQGMLLGAAFLLSTGEADINTSARQAPQQVEMRSWVDDNPSSRAVARQMNMRTTATIEKPGEPDAVAVALERASQQRSWVF
ncbi:hypothetical protein [Halopseudomonas salina]|uniref:Uncharacterized protein n=1 Tax=Halopseudomonas salina TaxID=1323744 RepID=A0ABQ1NZR1_9GAMM|nr:hypothetical protein [Halopseudomonas salina]GGC87902.1 hypothetical protein GCM10007418_04530 [Halopseudomonas salina]